HGVQYHYAGNRVCARHHFFFQAEDGIRDFHVTGVQTCALPILLQHLLGVEGALLAGEALHDHLGGLVDENAHVFGILGSRAQAALAAATALRAPSLMSSAGVMARPEFFRSSLPASTFVPSRRTTTGT